MILFLLSFLAGVLTVLAPCTISLLPVIVGGSLAHGDSGHSKIRSLVVTVSLGVSVILFTLILKVSTLFIDIPQSFWQIFSGVIIFALGFVMIFPAIWEKIPLLGKINIGGNRLLATGYKKQSFTGDILMGAALGPVFSSCSPTYFLILATVLPRSIGAGIVYLVAYVVGLSGFLFVITIISQKAVEKLGFMSDNRGWLKRSIGTLFLVLGLAIIFGFDKKIELAFSSQIFDVTKIEQKFLADQTSTNNALNNITLVTPDVSTTSTTLPKVLNEGERIKIKSAKYSQASEITNPSGFINTSGMPITLSSFKGKKVVLVDFWTYSCINCQRTIPYLNAWYQKYKDQGFEIMGIHTPEFAFEKVQKNVEDGVKRFGIQYPVVLDNDYGTWNAFGNQYWPRKYLIDIDGYIVYDHAGEGAYDVTEQAIQKALAERARVLGSRQVLVPTGIVAPQNAINVNPNKVNSPETYFGASRNEYLKNGDKNKLGAQKLVMPESFDKNNLYLSGTWSFNLEYAETSDTSAKIIYKYNAKNVYFVASSVDGADLKILLDAKPITTGKGGDVNADSTVRIKENRLYKIVEGADYGEHTLEIDITNGTLDAYTFTFG